MLYLKVAKKSGKPFKSQLKANTVKGETINPNTGKKAYTFWEDESIVDQDICIEVDTRRTCSSAG